MTPEEARVIEAARAVVQAYSGPLQDATGRPYRDLCDAVAALPASLAERLPKLGPGAEVLFGAGIRAGRTVVLANIPSHRVLVGEWGKSVCIVQYDTVTSIVFETPDAG